MGNLITNIIKSIFGNKSNDNVTRQNDISDNDDYDHYFDFDLIEKKEFIHLESAYQNQKYVFRRATESNRLILGELIEPILKVNKSSLLSMAVAYRIEGAGDPIEESVINSAEDIWNYDLFSCILKNKTDEGHYTKGMFHETTLIVKTNERNCIFVLTSLGGPDTFKYMRVSVLSPDNSIEDDGNSLQTQNAPFIASFILSYSEIDNNPDYQTYSIIEDSVKTKHESGQEWTELEREYVHGQFEFQGYYYVGYGRWLFEQNRYYDTFSILERAFNYLKSQIDDSDTRQVKAFYDICNIIGICLSNMDREDEACFYFRQGAPGLALTEANKLALCHAKLGNPIAMKQMTDWLMLVAQKYGDHQNWSEEVKQFSADVPVELTRYKKKVDEEIQSNPNYSEVITIGYILKELWGLNKKNLAPCMFIYDLDANSFEERIEDVDVISDYIVNKENTSNKVFVLSCTHVHYKTNDEEDKSILCHNAPIIISTHAIKGKESTANIRIDMIRQNFSNNDDKRDFVRLNIPLNATYTIGLPYGISYSQEKESLLAGIRKAIELVEEKRFIEAYKLSKWVFECVSNSLKDKMGIKFESEDELLWDIFFESSYNVGFCLMELNKPHTAAYYLEIASHSMNYKHIQEYINCLANSQDPQAIEVVEDVIQRSPKPDTKEDLMSWSNHMAFLKRRKAYVLIDRKRHSEARSLLSEMLNDPLCKDFAQDELNYLNAIESGQH
jgi:hypothetical protein